MIKKFKKILTFFAHPDDETLAMGGAMKKFSEQGSRIFCAIPNTGIHARKNKLNYNTRVKKLKRLKKDCYSALKILGVKNKDIIFGDFSDNEIDKHSLLSLIQWLEKIIEKVEPDVIFTHHKYCTNIDHRYCHEASVVATRPSVNFNIPVISCEVPSSTGYLKPANWEPNFFIGLNIKQIKKKIEALEKYSGEIQSDPHPRSGNVLKALAKVRGSESGYNYAESFMIQKLFLF